MSKGMRRAVVVATVVAVAACDCSEEPGGGDAKRIFVSWQEAAQSVDEGVGALAVVLVLSAAADRDIEVPYSVGGTAVNPDDHDVIGGAVTVPAGVTSAEVIVNLVDDIVPEGVETILFTLGVPSFGVLGTPFVHTVTILDNEAALTVVSPNGGEVWLAGDDELIAWTSRGGGSAVDVDFSLDNGSTWVSIASASADDGELTWTVPATASTSTRVRVSAGTVSDESDSVFEIRVPANRWFVDASASGGDGTSWAQAFATVQESVAAAAAGDEVWVANGTYVRNGSDNAVLVMPSGVTLLGGFDGGESERSVRQPQTYIAVLDGEGLVDHVVIGANGGLLDGFTITGGEANGTGPEGSGGGMFNHALASLMVRNCTFENNHAVALGGAVYDEACSGVLFESTRFADNDAGHSGGAMVNVDSQILVRDCVIESNESTGGAGGIDNRDGTAVIAATVIRDNANIGGGFAGGLVTSGNDRTILVDCVLARNRGYNGGAIYADGHELAVRRSLFYDNDAEVYGGAILAGGSSVEISSSTLVRNVTRGWPGVIDGWGGAYQMVNSIVWDNVAVDGSPFGRGGSTYAVSYSNVQPDDGFLDGGHNVSANPNFVDAAADDFRLGQASPGIDAADSGVAFTVDALGQARVDDPGMPDSGAGAPPADLGAFEFAGVTRLRLLAPNGGEHWDVGGVSEVTWEADGSISEVRVEVSCDGGLWRDVVAATTAATASFSWDPVSGPGGARCRVRVSDAADGSVWDESDAPFALASNDVWYVDASVAAPGDGSSWAAAMTSVQAAIAGADFGDEVRVAAGGYATVTMKEGVDLLGGWDAAAGTREIIANPTILSGAGSSRVVVAADALIDGFIIDNGDASGGTGWGSYGGGMLVDSVSPTVSRCTFRNNHAAMHGGALFVTGHRAAPVIEDCRFESNSAVNGGCLYLGQGSQPSLVNTVFDGCSALLGYGGAVGSNDFARPSLLDCTFANNQAANGGALGLFNLPATTVIDGCTFEGNSAEQNGGAIQVVSGALYIVRSWFEDNDAFVRGGAIYATEFGTATGVQLTSSVLVRNQAYGTAASHGGGALYLANGTTATLTNCTTFENTADGVGGAAFVHQGELTIVNSILWDDSDSSSTLACPGSGADNSELFVDSGSITVSYSDVADRCQDGWPGEGNIDVDPQFLDPGTPVDLRLTTSSPCIDVAHGDFLPTTDFDRHSRYDHVTTNGNFGDPPYGDMGAFEYAP